MSYQTKHAYAHEFLVLPEQDADGNHFELDEGQLITLSPADYSHARRVAKVVSYLDRILDPDQYEIVCGKAGIVLASDPNPTIRGMDVAVLHRDVAPENGMLWCAPLLIAEVISPGDDPSAVDRKRD